MLIQANRLVIISLQWNRLSNFIVRFSSWSGFQTKRTATFINYGHTATIQTYHHRSKCFIDLIMIRWPTVRCHCLYRFQACSILFSLTRHFYQSFWMRNAHRKPFVGMEKWYFILKYIKWLSLYCDACTHFCILYWSNFSLILFRHSIPVCYYFVVWRKIGVMHLYQIINHCTYI